MNGLYEEFDSIQTHIYQDSLSSQSTQAAWPSGWGRRISQAQVQTLTTKLELFLERLLFNSSVMLVNSQLLASRQLGLSSPLRLVDILFSIYFFSVYEAYPWTSWVQLSALTTIQLHLNIFFREQGSRRFVRYALRSKDQLSYLTWIAFSDDQSHLEVVWWLLLQDWKTQPLCLAMQVQLLKWKAGVEK